MSKVEIEFQGNVIEEDVVVIVSQPGTVTPPSPQDIGLVEISLPSEMIPGPPGPVGPRGPTGDASTVPGPVGPTGATGATGATGGQIMFIGDNPPASPVVGQTWFESDTGNSFVYYDDGNSVQWVPSHVGALPSGGSGILDGVGPPADSLGAHGDYYTDSVGQDLYGPKADVTYDVAKTCQVDSVPPNTSGGGASFGCDYKFLKAGRITGGRFYRVAASTVTSRTMKLYTLAGVLLATSNPTTEAAGTGGWTTAVFPSPVLVNVNDSYVIVFDKVAADSLFYYGGSPTMVDPAAVSFLASRYGNPNEFPVTAAPGSNYYVDILWQQEATGLWPMAVPGFDKPYVDAQDALKVNRAGDQMTGILTGVPSTSDIAGAPTTIYSFQVIGAGGDSDAAFMTFHRPNKFACFFGLDTDNQFKIGGWSFGSVAHTLWHSGNFSASWFASATHTHPQSDITGLTTDLAARVLKAGDTMTGALVLPATGTAAATSLNFGTAGTGFYGTDIALMGAVSGVNRLTLAANGDLTNTGLHTVGTTVKSSSTTLVLGQTGTGSVIVRPSGYLNTAAQVTINATGMTATMPFIAPVATAAAPSLRIPHGAAPTTPVDGDIWTTTAGLFVRINGVTIGPLS